MESKFELIDFSKNSETNYKKEVARVFESFKKRVSDYCRSNQVSVYGIIVINPNISYMANAKMLTPNIYLNISDIAYANSNMSDLINRLRFFRFEETVIDKLLFVISNINEPTFNHIKNTDIGTEGKLSIDELLLDIENKLRLKRWVTANSRLNEYAEALCIYGPSGAGKSTCVFAIANELALPIKIINIDELFGSSFSNFEKTISAITERTLLLFDNFDILFNDLAKREQLRYEMAVKRNCILNIFKNKNLLITFTLSSVELLPPDFLTRISLFVKLEYPNTEARMRLLSKYSSDVKKNMVVASKLNGYSTRELVSLLDKIIKITNSFDLSVLSEETIISIIEDLYGNKDVIFTPDGHEYCIIKPNETFDRVVLPLADKENLLTALSSIINEKLIYDTWGFREIDSNVRSIINFYGPPGTGKTMCASAITNLLSEHCHRTFELLSLKYSEIESMYVGEAPKKLEKVFSYAQNKDVVLFFDEADSFLGKRIQNVSQGSEQAINSLRSTMLIQLEKYKGVVIFATNLSANYDPAFKTRFLAEIEFKLPNKDLCIEIFKKNIPQKVLAMLSIIEPKEWESLGEMAVGISGRDIKTIIWRVLAKAARFEGSSYKFSLTDFINETTKYKEEKCLNQNSTTKAENARVTSVSNEDKIKLKENITSLGTDL